MPYELNDKDHSSALCDIGPGIHFYQEFNQVTVKCNYYLTKFNEDIYEPKQSTDVLSLCHVNIRSARKNIGAFENYLNILKHEFTVIGLTETWLNDYDFDLYGLSGYKVIAPIELFELVVVWQFVYRTKCLLDRDQTFPVSLKILKQSTLKLEREIRWMLKML